MAMNFLCPYQSGTLYVSGTKMDQFLTTFELQVTRCTGSATFRNTTISCANNNEIDSFLRDIEVEVFTRTKQFNNKQ